MQSEMLKASAGSKNPGLMHSCVCDSYVGRTTVDVRFNWECTSVHMYTAAHTHGGGLANARQKLISITLPDA